MEVQSVVSVEVILVVWGEVTRPMVELVEAVKLRVSADRRLAANSKELRVRVEGSKKRRATVFPRRTGTFLMDRVKRLFMGRAVSRMASIWASR